MVGRTGRGKLNFFDGAPRSGRARDSSSRSRRDRRWLWQWPRLQSLGAPARAETSEIRRAATRRPIDAAANDSYKAGVGTLTDSVSTQTGLASARANVARAHAQSLINGASLAFAEGLLTSRADFAPRTPR